MNDIDCHLLDDFLDGELTADENWRFVDHLRVCPLCRDNVESQQSLESLICQVGNAEIVPSSIVLGAKRAIRRLLVIRRLTWGVSIAATLGLAAIMSYSWSHRDPIAEPPQLAVSRMNRGDDGSLPHVGQPDSELPKQKDVLNPNLDSTYVSVSDGFISVDCPSTSDDVTFLIVYPTIQSH